MFALKPQFKQEGCCSLSCISYKNAMHSLIYNHSQFLICWSSNCFGEQTARSEILHIELAQLCSLNCRSQNDNHLPCSRSSVYFTSYYATRPIVDLTFFINHKQFLAISSGSVAVQHPINTGYCNITKASLEKTMHYSRPSVQYGPYDWKTNLGHISTSGLSRKGAVMDQLLMFTIAISFTTSGFTKNRAYSNSYSCFDGFSLDYRIEPRQFKPEGDGKTSLGMFMKLH